jgi:hypothetical protein
MTRRRSVRIVMVLLAILGVTYISAARAACGGLGDRLCNFFQDGRGGCDGTLVDVLGKCESRGDCGSDGKRLCFLLVDGRGACDRELIDMGGTCGRPDCGGQGQRACALVGRDSCNDGFVEVNNACFRRGDCGDAGQRACLIGERTGNSCDGNFVERNGMCIRTNCGALGQHACAIVGRTSCDDGLVEVNDTCFTSGNCGNTGQRACLIGERTGNSCNDGLFERDGMCRGRSCGTLGQRACAIVGRNSCNDGLVDVNDVCFARAECGRSNERACLAGERSANSCDPDHVELSGVCYPCGALGQSACAIAGRLSCDPGLVEANDMCFTRGSCGAARQRVCLTGERKGRSCDAGLGENHGLCLQVSGPEPAAPAPPKFFVFVRTDPPAPVLLPKRAVTIIASVHDGTTHEKIPADLIEIFQSGYSGPGSPAPRLLHSCNIRSVECKVTLGPGKLPKTISYMARATTNGVVVFETPIRLTDLGFAGAPVRMNVSAEKTPPRGIAEVSHKRTIDIVLFAGTKYDGTGYDLAVTTGVEAFSLRLKDEMETMVGIHPTHKQPSSLADHLEAVNFHVSQAPARLEFSRKVDAKCEHSTVGPVAFGDAQGILHPNFDCGDWSVPGPFYSAKSPEFSWHEMHHAAFGLSDEYCNPTVHSQHPRTPNAYIERAQCLALSSNPATCRQITSPVDCVEPDCTCHALAWRSDSGPNDVMIDNTIEQADDLRSINRKFDECKAGLC